MFCFPLRLSLAGGVIVLTLLADAMRARVEGIRKVIKRCDVTRARALRASGI